jgi:hypothetical protein
MASTVWVDGANRVTLTGLEDSLGPIEDATVAAVVTIHGASPLTAVPMPAVEDVPGSYSVVIPALAGATPNKRMTVTVTATSAGSTRTWETQAVVLRPAD